MFQAQDVREGMTVRSMDGEKLGKVVVCQPAGFVVEKGFFFPKDYFVRHDEVSDIRDGEILLGLSAESLRSATEGRGEIEGRGAHASSADLPAGTREEIRVPVVEEELAAEKHVREAGQVRVRKDVTAERRSIEVPITKEEVRVERVPASGEARAEDAAFREGTVSVPVREEEVEIRKRPVVREEVRVSKTARREERRADADVRKENVDVEGEGDVERARPGFRGERDE